MPATRLEAINPSDSSVITTIPSASGDEVRIAAARARSAQALWARKSFAERAAALRKARGLFAGAKDDILAALISEHGKSEAETMWSEVLPGFDLFDYWILNTAKLLGDELLPFSALKLPGKRGRIVYEPKGVIGIISPWNYPINLPLRTIIPALMAGNAVLFKPSEHAVLSGQILERVFKEALPEGLFATLQGAGDVGAALLDADIDHVSFTGSVATGRRVGVRCAERLISCGLELGGKNAAIVLSDAPLERTVNGLLFGGYHNAGQNCSAPSRVFVQRAIADRFILAFQSAVAGLEVGTAGRFPILPLRGAFQKAVVERHVTDARGRGAKILVGGEDRPGCGYAPTLLVDVPPDADVVRQETFGPVVAITVFDTVDEAVRLANDTEFGLSASVWTRNVGIAEQIARQLNVGSVVVNNACFNATQPFAPWGGRKNSGHGYTNSHLALKELVHAKAIVIDEESSPHELWWYPYTANKRAVADTLFALMAGKGGISTVFRLLGLMPKKFE